jgi:hypothetical protein
MKLEIKHLAHYLPYKLKCKWKKSKPYELIGLRKGNQSVSNELWIWKDGLHYNTGYLYECIPILRPLSDLTKEIEVNGEKFVPIERLFEVESKNDRYLNYLEIEQQSKIGMKYISYGIVEKLAEWHIDFQGLIEKQLAIDINTLK